MMTWDQLQKEQSEWRQKNFGIQPPHHPLLGVMEELGELRFAINTYDVKEQKDALADVCVFMASFCTLTTGMPKTFAELHKTAQHRSALLLRLQKMHEPEVELTFRHVTLLAHHFLKMEQNIRGSREDHLAAISECLESILEGMYVICTANHWDLLQLTEEVWLKVKQRDWTKNAANGNEHLAK